MRFSGSDLVIENSELYAPSFVLLVIGSGGATHQVIRLRNNAVTAAFAFMWSNGCSVLERKVEMVENNVLGGAFFSINDANKARMRVNVERNVLDVHTVLSGHMPWKTFVPRVSNVEWAGREKLFA
jgi:hypothetical protein